MMERADTPRGTAQAAAKAALMRWRAVAW